MTRMTLFEPSQLQQIRSNIYHSSKMGLHVLKGFVTEQYVARLRSFWLDKQIDQDFHDFVANRDVRTGTPNYYYAKPEPNDRAYCCFLWNQPPCELTHELAFEIQIMRNKLEGNPLYHGLNGIGGHNLQYRVCNSVSAGQIVYPHGDFIEQERRDPAGSHDFDPSRIQATLVLSSPKKDYDGAGFVFTTNTGKEVSFAELNIQAGDLVFWRYGNIHQVKDLEVSQEQTGFLRIIYPTFEFDDSKQTKDKELLGRINGKEIYQTLKASE